MWQKSVEEGKASLPWLVGRVVEMAWTVKRQPRKDGEILSRDVC